MPVIMPKGRAGQGRAGQGRAGQGRAGVQIFSLRCFSMSVVIMKGTKICKSQPHQNPISLISGR